MENKSSSLCRVKPITKYLKESFKFYDLDRPVFAQIIFIIQLAVIFGGNIIARPFTNDFLFYYEQMSIQLIEQAEINSFDPRLLNPELLYNMTSTLLIALGIFLAVKAVSYLISIYYGAYYYYSLTRVDTSLSERNSLFFQKFVKIIAFNLIYYFIFAVFLISLSTGLLALSVFLPGFSVLVLILPVVALFIDLLFVFKNLLIIEFDVDIFKNFSKSIQITKGCKRRIIFNGVYPLLLTLILNTLAVDIQNPLLSLFVVSFFEVIIILLTRRLITLMFLDVALIERHDNKIKNDEL